MAEDGQGCVSAVTGRFVDPELEGAFRLETWDAVAEHVRRIAVAAAGFFLLGFAVDVALIGWSPPPWTLLGLRIATAVAVVVTTWWMTSLRGGVVRFDRGLFAIMLGAAASTSAIIGSSPGSLMQHALTVLVMLLVYYLFLPARVEHAVVAGLVFSAVFLGVAIPKIDPPAGATTVVVLYLALANVLGAMALVSRVAASRREVATRWAVQNAHDKLVDEIDGRARAERALAESEERYRTLVELAPEAIIVHRGGRVAYANSAAARLVGAEDGDEVRGHTVFDVVQASDHAVIRNRIDRMQNHGEDVGPVEIGVRSLDGRVVYCEVVSAPVPFEGASAVQSVVRDIGERRQLEAELRRLATTDFLTGAVNRRRLLEELGAEWSRSARHDRRLSLLMIDVDRFKRINDEHGHAVGDQVLCAVVERIRSVLRSSDTLGRIGGDEFAAILPEIDREGTAVAADRIRKGVRGEPVSLSSGPVELTVSIGGTECRIGTEGSDEALKRGDDALYEAKSRGRDRVVIV